MSLLMSEAGFGKILRWSWKAIFGAALLYLYFLLFERASRFSGEGLEEFIYYQYMWPWTETATGRFIMIWLVLPAVFIQTFFLLFSRISIFPHDHCSIWDGWYERLVCAYLLHCSFLGFFMVLGFWILHWIAKRCIKDFSLENDKTS